MRTVHDVDLEVLRLFDVLYRERHVTRAARVVGLSQPAMSRALQRMRSAFRDELFVRTPKGMIATPRADELAPAVRHVIESVDALKRPAKFDPAVLVRDFAIGTIDMLDSDVVPRVARLLSLAPGVSVTTRPLTPDSHELLERGALDAWASPFMGKKGRSGFQLNALAQPLMWKDLGDWLLRHSSTFGLRYRAYDRLKLARRIETRDTPHGQVRFKVGLTTDGAVIKEKAEYEDLKKVWETAPDYRP